MKIKRNERVETAKMRSIALTKIAMEQSVQRALASFPLSLSPSLCVCLLVLSTHFHLSALPLVGLWLRTGSALV